MSRPSASHWQRWSSPRDGTEPEADYSNNERMVINMTQARIVRALLNFTLHYHPDDAIYLCPVCGSIVFGGSECWRCGHLLAAEDDVTDDIVELQRQME